MVMMMAMMMIKTYIIHRWQQISLMQGEKNWKKKLQRSERNHDACELFIESSPCPSFKVRQGSNCERNLTSTLTLKEGHGEEHVYIEFNSAQKMVSGLYLNCFLTVQQNFFPNEQKWDWRKLPDFLNFVQRFWTFFAI